MTCMKHVSIKEARDHLPALVREVEKGIHIVITRNGEPVAEVVPHRRKKGGIDFEGLRKWKEARGIDRIFGEPSPDFDEPLSEDFLITPIRYPDEAERP